MQSSLSRVFYGALLAVPLLASCVGHEADTNAPEVKALDPLPLSREGEFYKNSLKTAALKSIKQPCADELTDAALAGLEKVRAGVTDRKALTVVNMNARSCTEE